MSALDTFREAVRALESAQETPYGPPVTDPQERQVAGQACVALCGGNQDQARTLWRLVTNDLSGYMPRAAAVALIRASDTTNIVPDVTAPEVL